MDYSPLLAPVVALVAWTLVMMVWMALARGREFKRLGISRSSIPAGSRGADLEGRADPRAQWKAHNYMHLLEQPTIFYAIVFVLVLMNFDAPINVWLAWAYVGLRILHSLVQATVNIVMPWRFGLFFLSTLCLLALTVHAGLKILHDCEFIG
ncbi:MAG: MAPEG family protein [Sphingomicrobium sp.]